MSIDAPVILNEIENRFELHLDGHMAYEVFERFPIGITYLHTIVPEELGGRGVGGTLVKHALDYARGNGLKVRPKCSFVESYIDKHPEYQDVSLAHGASEGP